MMLKFEKYHGAGNDFIIVNEKDLIELGIPDYAELAIKICDRHYGIGADGFIILKYVANMPFMFFYNPDGSQAPMCGNGIRTFAQFLKNNKIENNDIFTVKTLAGDMKIEISPLDNEEEFLVKVNMGKPLFDVKNLININSERFLKQKLSIDGVEIEISYIFMGTDHCVIFVDDFHEYDIDVLGSKIEKYTQIFSKGVNVNFVKIRDFKNIEVITWERGAGKTLACGTGIAASAVLSKIFGYTEDKVNVLALGGTLVIEYKGEGENVFMTGPSEKIAEGYYNLKR